MPTPIRDKLRELLSDHDSARAMARQKYERGKELNVRADELKAEIARLVKLKAQEQAKPIEAELADVVLQHEKLNSELEDLQSHTAALAAPLRRIAEHLKINKAGTMNTGAHSIVSLREAVS